MNSKSSSCSVVLGTDEAMYISLFSESMQSVKMYSELQTYSGELVIEFVSKKIRMSKISRGRHLYK